MNEQCLICLEDLPDIESNIKTWKCKKCKIQMHKKCINEWKKNKKKYFCPHCKNFYIKKKKKKKNEIKLYKKCYLIILMILFFGFIIFLLCFIIQYKKLIINMLT